MPQKTSLKLLVIDDNPSDRMTYRRLLKRSSIYDYEFHEAPNGEEGLDLCFEIFPDCILLDYHMPDMTGMEVLRELTGESTLPFCPVIMLTSQGDELLAVEAMKTGAQDYFPKDVVSTEALELSIVAARRNYELLRTVQRQRLKLERQHVDLQFFAATIHQELRYPLRTLGTLVREALDEMEDDAGATVAPGLLSLDDTLHKLDRVVEHLSDYAELSTEDQESMQVDLEEVAAQVITSLTPQIEETGATISVGALGSIYGRRADFRRLFYHIFLHALRFPSRQAPPQVSLFVEEVDRPADGRGEGRRRNQTVKLLVIEDNSMAYDTEELRRILDELEMRPYQGLEESSEVTERDLTIMTIWSIAKRAGGRLHVDSREGFGVRYMLYMPDQDAAGREPEPREIVL